MSKILVETLPGVISRFAIMSFRIAKKRIIYAKRPEGNDTGNHHFTRLSAAQVAFPSTKRVVHREEIILISISQKILAEKKCVCINHPITPLFNYKKRAVMYKKEQLR